MRTAWFDCAGFNRHDLTFDYGYASIGSGGVFEFEQSVAGRNTRGTLMALLGYVL